MGESNRWNNYAISTADLATSLTKSSGSLVAANGTLEEAVALTATANTIIQDADVVGTALKTVAMRLRGTDTKTMEEEGLEIDGAVTSKSKLRGKVKALSGVDILTDTGAYKSTYQILSDIAAVWKDINDMDQAALLELLAGKRAGSVMSAILQNPQILKDAFESANNASGSALRENEKYLDSIQGRIDLFNNAVQTMWNTELDTGVVKFFINLGTSLVKVVDNLGLINTLVFGLMSYFTIFRKNKFDIASMIGLHDVEQGWFYKKKNKQGSAAVPTANFKNLTGEQTDMFSDESQMQYLINDKKSQIKAIKAEIKSLERMDWKDINIPEDALEYTNNNAKRKYVKEVLIPNKQAEITAIQKDIDDITLAAKLKLDQSKTKLMEDNDGQIMFDVDGMSQALNKANTKYLDIFQNGLGKGATEKLNVDFDVLGARLKDLEGLNGKELRDYMLNLDSLGDISEDTRIALAGYASTVENGTYSVQGAQRYVREYNKNLAVMSKEASIAQLKQNMLNLAISGLAMVLSYALTSFINWLARFQNTFEELSSQLSSTTSELESINSELDNTKNKIEEILNKGTLSFTDQEELDRLRAQNEELERQKVLKEAIQKQQQKGVNSASVKAANGYYKNTGKNTGKTTGELTGEGAKYGLMAGGVAASVVASSLSVGATNIWNPIGWAALVLAAITAVGAGIGATVGLFEDKVGESMDNMREQYETLQSEYNAAQSKYATKSSDGNYKKMQEAQEKLTEYETLRPLLLLLPNQGNSI